MTHITLLVVDDVPELAGSLVRLFSRLPEFDSIGVCHDGLEAVAMVADSTPTWS